MDGIGQDEQQLTGLPERIINSRALAARAINLLLKAEGRSSETWIPEDGLFDHPILD
jgi:hypothetical protein